MYFDTSDLIVFYSGIDISLKQFCPLSAPFDVVDLWLGHKTFKYSVYSVETVPLEKATSLTLEQFSQLMTGDPQKACFSFSEDVYP